MSIPVSARQPGKYALRANARQVLVQPKCPISACKRSTYGRLSAAGITTWRYFVLRSTIWVVISSVQHIIFEDERIPLSKQNASFLGVVSQTVMGRFHSIRKSFNDELNVFIIGLGVMYAF